MRDPQWLKRRRRAQKSACSSRFMITQADAWKSLHRGPREPGILETARATVTGQFDELSHGGVLRVYDRENKRRRRV